MNEQKSAKIYITWNENKSIAITDNGMSITNPHFQSEQALDGEQS